MMSLLQQRRAKHVAAEKVILAYNFSYSILFIYFSPFIRRPMLYILFGKIALELHICMHNLCMGKQSPLDLQKKQACKCYCMILVGLRVLLIQHACSVACANSPAVKHHMAHTTESGHTEEEERHLT